MGCMVDDCERPGRVDAKTGNRYFLKGFCSLHYQRLRKRGNPLAGRAMKHGMHKTPTYYSWGDMIQRCTNPNNTHYSYYGGRGITVCERWLSFSHFYKDMGMKPQGYTLDRIDNDGNYEPNNCKWSTRKEQANNRRNNLIKQGV